MPHVKNYARRKRSTELEYGCNTQIYVSRLFREPKSQYPSEIAFVPIDCRSPSISILNTGFLHDRLVSWVYYSLVGIPVDSLLSIN